jgi:hypothetical protein
MRVKNTVTGPGSVLPYTEDHGQGEKIRQIFDLQLPCSYCKSKQGWGQYKGSLVIDENKEF